MSEFEGKTILIVEDNKTISRQLTALLTKYGATVFQAGDGVSGVERAAEENPDVILMDVQMPEMDGYEATRIIKENNDTKNIPIIMLTGNKDGEDMRHGLGCGACAYLTKPVSGKTIVAVIKEYLGQS